MIDIKEVLRYLQTYSGTKDENLLSLINKCTETAYKTVTPKTAYRIFECEVSDNEMIIAGEHFKSKRLAETVKGCGKCVVFGATLGTESDRLLRRAASESAAETAVYQAVLAALTEEVCDKLEDEIKQRYSFKLRRRYSPGYFDLDIKNQTKIFRLLELTKRCGITLTNKMLMIPSKSVTAIIGVEDEN